jgi:hypothetical protein
MERLLSKIKIVDGCWVWQGYLTQSGYGQVQHGSKLEYVHRIFYRHYKGQIASGLHVDHLCRNRACSNPEHLEAVSPRINTLRGVSSPAVNSRKTVCKRGHALDAANTYRYPNGNRECRTCKRRLQAAYRVRRRQRVAS